MTETGSEPHGRIRSTVVGSRHFKYRVWTHMLSDLLPDGRTHRLGIVISGKLHHAVNRAAERDDPTAATGYVRWHEMPWE